MKRTLSTVLTLVLCLLSVSAQTKLNAKAEKAFQKGVNCKVWNEETGWHEKTGDYARALMYYEEAAALGHGEAAYRAAIHYVFGLGCTKDLAKAAYYYEMAIENKVDFKDHYQLAANNAGWNYMTEPSIRNYDKAFKYLQIGVEHENKYSYSNLGYLYLFGLGCEKDAAKAFSLCTESLNKGNQYANNHLAYMYYYGEGVEQNYEQAWKCVEATKNDLSEAGKFIRANCLFFGYAHYHDFDQAHNLYDELDQAGFAPAKQMFDYFYTEKDKEMKRMNEKK